MPIQYSTLEIEQDLQEFIFKLEQIDMEEVKGDTLRQVAVVLTNFVKQAVIDSPYIESPAVKHESGPGPSMSTQDAWQIQQDGDEYIVRPHPQVRQRAIVLNDGYPVMTPNQAEYMKFTVFGVPQFRKAVPGPVAAGYWEAAFDRLEKSGEFERIAENRLQKEIEEHV